VVVVCCCDGGVDCVCVRPRFLQEFCTNYDKRFVSNFTCSHLVCILNLYIHHYFYGYSHGGVCRLGLFDQYENQQFFCDCSTAIEVSETDKIWNIRQYVGRFCEQAVTEEALCDASNTTTADTTTSSNSTDKQFCLNGGTCNAGDALNPCKCPSTHTGAHCEYPVGEVPTCDLDCGQHGVCRLGMQELTKAEKKAGIVAKKDYQYCVCRQNYVGEKCQYLSEKCPGGQKVCLNGCKYSMRAIQMLVTCFMYLNVLYFCDSPLRSSYRLPRYGWHWLRLRLRIIRHATSRELLSALGYR
jgi:hypothetical protein